MRTREISRDQWKPFLDELSRVHLGQRVRVEILSDGVGVRTEAQGLPLLGITTDRDGGNRELIEVILGDSPHAHLTHAVPQPEWLHASEDDAGLSALQIVAADGSKTVVHFARPAARNTPQAFA